MNTQLNIFGTVTGSKSTSTHQYDPNNDIRLSMSTPTINHWYSSPNYMYHYNFNVTNVGTSPLAGFELEIKFNHNISSIDIWNYEYKLSGNTLTILAPAKALNPNDSVEVSFIVGSPSSIVTNSMKPTITKGDMVLVQKCDIDDIEINDIIQYKLNSYTVVHRVISIDNLGGYKVFTTKGDNNHSIDKKVVQENQIIGKVKFKIPFLGYPTYLIKTIFSTNGNIEVETGVD